MNLLTVSPKIAIIVPVYDAEKYLPSCIDSIISQSFIEFELLLIDDGSKDRSGEICDNYMRKDRRISVFHQKNMGVVSARRFGVLNVSETVEYIFFVDADDEVPSNGITLAYQKMRDLNLDILITSECLINIKNGIVGYSKYETVGFLSKDSFAIELLIGPVFFMAPHGRMFKKDIIINTHAMDLDESILLNEDLLMNLKIGSQASRIFITNDIVSYHYRLRKDGAGHRKVNFNYWCKFFDICKHILCNGYSLLQKQELQKAFLCMQLDRLYDQSWNKETVCYKQNLISQLKSMKGLRHDSQKQLCIIQYPAFTFWIKVFFKIRKTIKYKKWGSTIISVS